MQVKIDKKYRPDPRRAIYLCGEINDNLCCRLVEQINELRSNPDGPITVYINSPGGITRFMDVLVGLLSSPDINGIKGRTITVVSGDANSAAAMFLAMGDYALAYPHSSIHFHGVRFQELSEDLTTERAIDLAKSMESRNRHIALRVARSAIKRLAHRYAVQSSQYVELKKEYPNASELTIFVQSLALDLSDTAWEVAVSSLAKAEQVLELRENTIDKISFDGLESQLESDILVLKELLDYEAQTKLKDCQHLEQEDIDKIVSDYLLLNDYFFGRHTASRKRILDTYGGFFFDDAEREHFNSLADDLEQQEKWMYEQLSPRIEQFWYFTVMICRRLHEGENRLTASDAYWLGLVDEVIGTPLTGFRSLFEQAVNDQNPSLDLDGSNASPPPPSQSPSAVPESTPSPEPSPPLAPQVSPKKLRRNSS